MADTGGMRITVGYLFLCCFLQCCSAKDINCTVTQYANQTIYIISEMSNANASSAVYTWANASGTVLARDDGKNPEQVVSYSIKALITLKCFHEIVYNCHPHSETRGYMAHCRINCTLNPPSLQKQKEISHNWIAPTAIAIFLGLVLVLVGLCIRFRPNISRICSRDQLRCIYTAMTMQKVDPKDANVEAGNV
ncbi:uncharacterized protein LOC144466936 isoform X1 [Epinephelus lanceolatus]